MTSFDTVAAFYEVLSDSGARLQREGPLLAEWLDRAPSSRVCDIACGTGIHAEFFANRGAQIVALDASPEMVRHAAARRPHDRIEYRAADMRRLPQLKAGLIVCLGNSMSLLANVEEVRAVVADVADRLEPGGLFCAQVVNNSAEGMNQPRHRIERKKTEDGTVIAVKNLVPQGEKTLLALNFFHESKGAYQTAADTAVLLHLALNDFKTAGLEVAQVYGGYDKRPFDPATSPDLIVVMAKK